ncbi:Bug family tripartite tricarboxylate transporter substrate binding protein [Cupriavidus metallidurans]|uniref:Bug family tripartite tricarboxylate transporter substrate binding protein n=1 Tax=Cupriavidus metallidurans TaxID=119219 RepID=UPI001CCA0B11|nr:tripartite tricarboxylate transporter substrate binding protein [Cupriavidus metallidurans]UBM11283.1 tripartite tricarboxylate transporter substrate binding protein [Cupriavidus metallidurans]
MLSRRHTLKALIATFAAGAVPAVAHADTWPAKPIRMIVPFPPGSSPDLIARIVTEKLATVLGQPVVVENRPGAGGNIGTGMVAKAAPDGYTLLFTINGPLVTAPSLYRHLSYDPMKQLAPVTLVATSPNVLVIDARLPVHTLREFVALAKSKPGALNYGSVGNGSAAHLAMEQLKAKAGIDLQHVPYPGFPQITTAIVGGQVLAGFMVPAIAMPMVNAGKLRILAVTTTGRTSLLPSVPTVAESGYPGFEAISWQAILAPAGTPAPVVDRLYRELVRIIGSDDIREKMRTQYFVPAGTAPASLRETMVSEKARWDKVIRAAGVQPEG